MMGIQGTDKNTWLGGYMYLPEFPLRGTGKESEGKYSTQNTRDDSDRRSRVESERAVKETN